MSRFKNDLRKDFLRIGGGRSRSSTTPTAFPSFTAQYISFTRHKLQPRVVGKKRGGGSESALLIALHISLSLPPPRCVHLTGRIQSSASIVHSRPFLGRFARPQQKAKMESPPPTPRRGIPLRPSCNNGDKNNLSGCASVREEAGLSLLIFEIRVSGAHRNVIYRCGLAVIMVTKRRRKAIQSHT
ncbi:hypothetical protein J6590_085620 [Homalodisca vitripennis]|nr:hypothetical protein J6590_085620 [Homalodisca vitripennis]